MRKSDIYVSELSATRHLFSNHHFCRGNSNKRKSRLGIILAGSGTYLYLDKKLKVKEGDAVFIPENVFCYSEWSGDPRIEVVYLSCFMHYERFSYEPQLLSLDMATKDEILGIAALLAEEEGDTLLAYSRFYRLLGTVLERLEKSTLIKDPTLEGAIEYIIAHAREPLSVASVAKAVCVSESTLYHLFKRTLGQTPIRFLHTVRINMAIEQLENTEHSVATVSRLVGFRSENHFRRVFFNLVGTTPLQYRKSR